MKKLLITGFDPFGGSAVNPSQLVVENLPEVVGDFQLKKLILPTVFGAASKIVQEAIGEWCPDVVLSVGVAEGRDVVTPERIAVNIRDARIPDNAGNQPNGAFVADDGPAAYFATLPLDRIVDAVRDAGVPARISNSAGAFVCNDVMYSVLHHCHGKTIRAGFVHIPALPGGAHPSLTMEQLMTALTATIMACD